MTPDLRLVFWETTKACNLTCKHCRAVPQRRIGPMELTTARAFDTPAAESSAAPRASAQRRSRHGARRR